MKEKTEYNGVEGYISDMINVENITWLPIERSLAIEDKKGAIKDAFTAVDNLEKEGSELQATSRKLL
jgi:hypothetical protein